MVDKSVEDCNTPQASGKEKTECFSDISSANLPSSQISILYVDYNTTENNQSKSSNSIDNMCVCNRLYNMSNSIPLSKYDT